MRLNLNTKSQRFLNSHIYIFYFFNFIIQYVFWLKLLQ